VQTEIRCEYYAMLGFVLVRQLAKILAALMDLN
jgi:hypothetical protein